MPRLAIQDLIGEVLTSSSGRTYDVIPVTRERWRSAQFQSVCFGSGFGEVRTFVTYLWTLAGFSYSLVTESLKRERMSSEGTIVDDLIRVGLMFGAVFQVICIAAVIWIPSSHIQSSHGSSDGSSSGPDASSGSEEDDDADTVSIEGASSTTSSYASAILHGGFGSSRKSRRREKKKHK